MRAPQAAQRLFSSSKVWSRTWCIPTFSSLALARLSVNTRDTQPHSKMHTQTQQKHIQAQPDPRTPHQAQTHAHRRHLSVVPAGMCPDPLGPPGTGGPCSLSSPSSHSAQLPMDSPSVAWALLTGTTPASHHHIPISPSCHHHQPQWARAQTLGCKRGEPAPAARATCSVKKRSETAAQKVRRRRQQRRSRTNEAAGMSSLLGQPPSTLACRWYPPSVRGGDGARVLPTLLQGHPAVRASPCSVYGDQRDRRELAAWGRGGRQIHKALCPSPVGPG